MNLVDLNVELRLHFKALGGERAGPVYLLEHPLSPEALQATTATLAEEIGVHDFPGERWDSRYLPLLVVASEVGYEFGSSGLEYWPVLSERLGADLVGDRRYRLRDYFRESLATTKLELPDTPWARRHSLIAWPITHAVLPMWLHERLLRCILRCTMEIGPRSDYLEEMRERAAGDLPLVNFLAEESLARNIIEGIVGDREVTDLTDDVVQRLRRDVLEAPRTRQLAREVRLRRIALKPVRPRAPARGTSADIVAFSPIALTVESEGITPRVPPLRLPITLPLAADRLRVRLLGAGRFVTLGALVQDGGALPNIRLDEPDPLLFATDEIAQVQPQVAAHLRGVRLDALQPIVFDEAASGDLARQVRERAFAPRGHVWVATDNDAPPPPSVVRRGEVLGVPCFRCDAEDRRAQQWLEAVGVPQIRAPAVVAIGSPSADQPLTAGGTLLPGDVAALQVIDGPVEVEGGATLRDGLHLLDLPEGPTSHTLTLRSAGARPVDLPLEVIAERPSRYVRAQLHLEGPATVSALSSRRLSIRATSPVPVSGLRLTLCAREIGGGSAPAVRAYSRPLSALPAIFEPEDPAWAVLGAGLSRDPRPVELRAELSGLASERWTLDLEEASVEARASEEEAGEEIRVYNGAEPWIVGRDAPQEGVALLQRFRLRPDGGAEPIIGAGVVEFRGGLEVGAHPVRGAPAHLPRRLDAASGTGARDLASAWLSWATAASPNLISGAARRLVAERLDRWLASALCGGSWAEAEERGAVGVGSFGSAVAGALWEAGVVRDEGADELLGAERAQTVVRTLGAALDSAEGWVRASCERPESAEKASASIAMMADAAYRRALHAAGLSGDEADVACPPDETMAAASDGVSRFDRARERSDLLAYVLPQSIRPALAELDYAAATDAELTSAINRELSSRREGARWTEAEAASLWAMWVRPMSARPPSLEGPLERALEDRAAARVIRYGALRRRAASGILL